MMANETIWLEEGTKSCSVSVVRSYREITQFSWQKDKTKICKHKRHLLSEKGVTFNNVIRNDAGNYSLTTDMSCHYAMKPRQFVGSFSLKVFCKYVYTRVNFMPLCLKQCCLNLDGPELTEADKTYSALNGDSVSLICGHDLKSNPSAIIRWTNPKGEPITSSERYTMNNGPEEVSLEIANVGKDDNGTWTCTVEVPRNNPLYCNSEQERVKDFQLQLIVVSKSGVGLVMHAMIHDCLHLPVPPNKPQNLHVEEVTSSSFHICWDEPEYHGSPYLTGYEVTYNDKKERIGVVDCFSFDNDHLEWGQSYNIAVSAISESGNETVAESSSSNSRINLLMGMLPILILTYTLRNFLLN